MQPCIFLHAFHLYQLHQSREAALGVHHLEDDIVAAVTAIV